MKRVQRHMFLKTWISEVWGAENAEPDPTAREYRFVLSIFSRPDTYELYCQYHKDSIYGSIGEPALSYKVFLKSLRTWMDEERVVERQKKNVTGKCDG